MMPYIWLGVVVLALVVEALTFALVSMWFIPGALVAMILSFFPPIALWVQILVFLLISLVFLIFVKPLADKFLIGKRTPTNADAVIGEEAVVTLAIDNIEGKGQVKVKGQIWTARSADKDITYEVGEVLHVIAIEGVKLICKK